MSHAGTQPRPPQRMSRDLWALVVCWAIVVLTYSTDAYFVRAYSFWTVVPFLGAAIMFGAVGVMSHAEDLAHKLGEPYGTLILALAVTVIDANTFTIAVATSGAGTARACTGRYILEYLTIGTPPVDSGWLHAPFMDRRVRLTGTFAAGKTTWALPATPTVASGSSQFNGFGSTLNTVFLGPAFGASNGNTVALDEYTTTSVKTSKALARTDGSTTGSITSRRALPGEAPRLWAACSSWWSKLRMAASVPM